MDSIKLRSFEEILNDFHFGFSLAETSTNYLSHLYKSLLFIMENNFVIDNPKLLIQNLRNVAFHNGFLELLSKAENYLNSKNWSFYSEKYPLNYMYQGLVTKKKVNLTEFLFVPNSEKYIGLSKTGKLELGNIKSIFSEVINEIEFDENFYDLRLSGKGQYVIALSSIYLGKPRNNSSIKHYKNKFYIWDIISKKHLSLYSINRYDFDQNIEFISEDCIGYSTEDNLIVVVNFRQDSIIGICDAHQAPIVSINGIPNSQFIISACEEKIILWDKKSSKVLKELNFKTRIKEVKLIEKENLALIFSKDKGDNTYLSVWNYKLNKKICEQKNGFYWIDLSDDDELKDKLREFERNPPGPILETIMIFHPKKMDESHFLIFEDKKIVIFEGTHCMMKVNYETGKLEELLPYSQRFKSLIEINQNSCLLLSDNEVEPNKYPVMLIDLEKFAFVPLFINVSNVINHTFPNGKNVIVSLEDHLLSIWDVAQLGRKTPGERIYDKAYISPNKEYIVALGEKDNSLTILNPESKETISRLQKDNQQIVFDNSFLSGGVKIAFQLIENGKTQKKQEMVIWNVSECNEEMKYELENEGIYQCVEISVDHLQFIPLQQEEYFFNEETMTIETLRDKKFYFSTVNGGYKCEFADNGSIQLFDIVSNELINELDVNFQWPKKVLIDRNGSFMVIIGNENLVFLWNLDNGHIEFEGEISNIETEIRFTSNLELCFINKFKDIEIWDLGIGKEIANITGPFLSCDLSNDGKLLCMVDTHGFLHILDKVDF